MPYAINESIVMQLGITSIEEMLGQCLGALRLAWERWLLRSLQPPEARERSAHHLGCVPKVLLWPRTAPRCYSCVCVRARVCACLC